MSAQSASTGALSGTVTDPTSAVVQYARIALRNKGTGEIRTATTDQDGSYRFSLLPPGEYELTMDAVGFAPVVMREVLIRITEVTSLATQLAVQGVRVDVDVQAPLLQTGNAALGRVITHDTIETLPLVNRNFTQILGLTGGTNTDVVDATLLGAGSQEIRANGARSSDNNFMLNGVDANSYGGNMTEATNNSGGGLAIPAPDTIQEFKVQSSLYAAQYGRGGGANVLVETKSGTSQFHGNLYYFGRNEALNANNFFANATGVPKGQFSRHQPGGTLGGPLPWLPKGGFFFVSYQRTRDVNAASLASSVRSLTLPAVPHVRTPASLGAIFGGQTGLFGGVAIAPDGSNINPVALNLLNARNPDGSFVIPSPQTAGSGVNYTAVLPGHYGEDQFNTNVDLSLSGADKLSVKFFFSNSNQDVPFSGASVPGFPALRDFNNRNLAIAQTHIFPAQTVNQFRAGFSRIASRSVAPSPLTAQSVGIIRVNDPQERSLPHIQILGGLQLGNAANAKNDTTNNNFYLSDTVSLSRGQHDFRFGAEIFRNEFLNGPDNTDGSLLFLSFSDFLLGLAAGAVSAGGNGTSLSNVYLSQVSAVIPHTDLRSAAAHFFAVDDWKVSGTLTVNLGLRLEVNSQQHDAHGELANFYPQYYVPPAPGGFTNPTTSGFVLPDNYDGSAPAGYPRTNSTLVNDAIQLHPEPRIGLTWRPSSSRDLVVRTGFGMYANRVSFFGSSVDLAFNQPFQYGRNSSGAANATSTLQHPFPVLPQPSSFPYFAGLAAPPYTGDRIPVLVVATDQNFKDATIRHYGLETQYQYQGYLFSIAYAGATGAHLPVSRSNNQPALASPANPVNGLTTNSVANAVERVPFLGVAPLLFSLQSTGTSRYDSLQATVGKRLSHGFQFLAAYTLSRSIDDAQDSLGSAAFGVYGATVFGEQVFNDQNDPAAQRGPSDFDRRHRFVVSGTWQLLQPASPYEGWLLRRLAEGWAVSGVVTLQSGLPFSILDSAAGTLYGPPTYFTTGSLAPGMTLEDAIRSGSASSRINQYFNTSAFVPAPFVPDGGVIDGKFPVTGGGTIFGDLGRNILRGPAQRNVDIAFIKRTRLGDKSTLVFRWEIFNVFNWANFANPASDVSSPSTFGKITAMSVNPRIMQFGLKLEF
ncbi:MAG TPA: carboxypeptidase-like regulatory domain-containing protein [Vicinamibacterales bacterium]|nr:carboxypeptidase-like regulatory domain-containing protein [Vicinamibacterales bacterium]